MIQVTGVAYGSVVSHPTPVHAPRLAQVVFGTKTILVRSFPVGAVIVTVESVIVALLRVVGALIVTIGGNLIVVVELFPAISYTVTTIVCTSSSGSRTRLTGLVAGLIVVGVPVQAHPSSVLYVTV